jgi:hypothetical protein
MSRCRTRAGLGSETLRLRSGQAPARTPAFRALRAIAGGISALPGGTPASRRLAGLRLAARVAAAEGCIR